MRTLVTLSLLLVSFVTAASTQDGGRSLQNWNGGMRGADGLLQQWLVTGSPIAHGDTLRVRLSILNIADTVARVTMPACGVSLGGDLRLRPLDGVDAACMATTSHRLAPADSVVVDRRAVVESEPGRYARSFALGRDHVDTDSLTVVPFDQRPSPRPTGGLLERKLPLFIDVSVDEGSGIDSLQVRNVLRSTLARHRWLPIRVSPEVARRLLGYGLLMVNVTYVEEHQEIWMQFSSASCLPTARHSSGSYPASPLGFGADLALTTTSLLEQLEASGCVEPRW